MRIQYATREGTAKNRPTGTPNKFTVDYPPTANLYWRHVRGRVIVSADAKAYRHKTALVALQAGCRPLQGNVRVRLDVYRPRKIGDLDNTLKVLLDSLRGIAYEDDKQVTEIVARRFDDKTNPRVEVELEETD